MASVRADQMQSLVADAVAAGIKVLSLDCFDTLIWRTTAHPTDVFDAPPMRLKRQPRVYAELEARKLRYVRDGKREVDLEAIYAVALGDDSAAIAAAIEAELAAEHAHCFAFAPTVDLIRAAKVAGLQVIVVSDTYLSAPRLRALIAHCAGADVAALIDRVFCSCEHGVSKDDGLFEPVLGQLGLQPDRILHVGDNRSADVDAPARLGVRTRHFEQFDDALMQQLRLEAAAASMLDAGLRGGKPLYQPFRALLAHTPPGEAGARLGHSTLGPLLFGFAEWLRAEARALSADGRPVKLLFMLRDGHLPKLAYDALAQPGDAPSYAIELSRFTAYAASLRTAADVDAYLAQFAHTGRYEAMAAQLLLDPKEARALADTAGRSADPARSFLREVKKPRLLKQTFERAAQLRARLSAYLQKIADPQPGERLVLVDLGYAGTVQDRAAPVLAEMFGVDVRGLYLLLRDVPGWQRAKRGMLGPDRHDPRAIDALCDYVALLEQMCTIEQGSVVDYGADGTPVRKQTGLASRQSDVRAAVQRGCLQFIAQAAGGPIAGGAPLAGEALRQASLMALARLLFFPSAAEVDLFKGFEHDINMGVEDRLLLFDDAACRDGLRNRGLFYVNDNRRQFLPAELRAHGLPLTLTLLAQRRFGLDLRAPDFSFDHIALPVMVANRTQSSLATIEAMATYDGYYLAAIPIGRCEYSIGVLFGRDFERVQLHAASVSRQDALFDAGDLSAAVDVLPAAIHEGARLEADGVLTLGSNAAFTYFDPPALDARHQYVLNVVFRPLQRRARQPAAAAASVSPTHEESTP